MTRHEKWCHVPDDQWNDWQWQMRNRVTTARELQDIMPDSAEIHEHITDCLKRLRMAITPYYASLINPEDPACPVRMQAVPTRQELVCGADDVEDPLEEDADSHTAGLVHRYPDRALLLVTDQCAMYCRHCTRRRFAGKSDQALPEDRIDAAISYIQAHPEIRDVIISGGDPLTLSDRRLDDILGRIRAIRHVEIIRIGTRVPVTLPQRITPGLCAILRRHQPVWVNTHFNHPVEMTSEAQTALAMLADAGVPLGNQSVLLKGVNNCPMIQRELVHALVRNRVRPYYLYQCDLSEGIEHFRTPVAEGIGIIEMLRGHTSGLAVPTFVVDAPGGGGKIPVGPNYLLTQSPDKVLLRNYEGITCAYPEPANYESRCSRCEAPCRQQQERGLARILNGEQRSLVPRENIRMQRRVTHETDAVHHGL